MTHVRSGFAAIDRRAPGPSQDGGLGAPALTPAQMGWKSVSTDCRSPQLSSIKVGLLIVAAGRGLRLGAERPKQYLSCAGRPLIARTLEALAAAWPFSAIAVAIRAEDRALYDEALADLPPAAAAAL